VQLSQNVQGVLRDIQQAFYGPFVNAGKQLLAAMMEADRVALCGAKNVPDTAGQAVRGGTTRSSVVLGGQRVAITKPRARSLQRGDLELPTFAWAADTDPLDMAMMACIAADVSTRRYGGTLEPLPDFEQSRSASKSSVSRRWVALSQAQLHEWLSGSLKELDLSVVMIDGIFFRGRVILVALGIDRQGNKHVMGLREGFAESTRVVRSLLSDLVERGLDADRARLWVIDSGKALRRAIVECFGTLALIQRCQEHNRRNVIEHLPQELHGSVRRAMREVWNVTNAETANKQLQRLAVLLQAKHPGAAGSMREGLEEALTVQTLGISGAPDRTLRTTNPVESLNGLIAHFTRKLKRWRDGAMTLRWVAGALSDARGRLRKLRGYRDMKSLMTVLAARQTAVQASERKAASYHARGAVTPAAINNDRAIARKTVQPGHLGAMPAFRRVLSSR
jgi:putative transposase